MSGRDDVLRAACYAASDAHGTPGYRAALERVIFVHRCWPLIEYAHSIERARQTVEQERARSARRTAEAIAAIRDSYPQRVAA